MEERDFIDYHLRQAVLAGMAESQKNNGLSRHLRAQVKLRLVSMSDEDIWKLAERLACPPISTEAVYEGLKQAITQHRADRGDWINDLNIELMNEV